MSAFNSSSGGTTNDARGFCCGWLGRGNERVNEQTENRDQTVGSMYLGVKVALADVDAALDDERIAEAFKQAEEAAKRVLGAAYLVEADYS
jgi:hypothetical protein